MGAKIQDNILPFVSVVIPSRNRAQMLARALDSILTQTYSNFEIIIVSDGSTDNTDEIVASFDDPRITYLKHDKAKGASAARNTGLKIVRGEYICFLDDDDEWVPDKLKQQLAIIEGTEDKLGLVYGGIEYYRDGKLIKTRLPENKGYIFDKMLDRQALGACPTIMLKRAVLDKVGLFDESLPRGNDGDYWRRITKHFEVDFVPEVVARIHLGHDDRISLNTPEKLLNHINSGKTRLRKFHEDFKKNRPAEAKVYFDILRAYKALGKPLTVFWFALRIIWALNFKISAWRSFFSKIRRKQ